MIDAVTLFQIRCQALAYAMETAQRGEDGAEVMGRAIFYADWLAEPLEVKAQADALGEAATERLQ
jgi:hypothetical protein